MTKSEQLFAEAQQVLPGGVNSPVRACRAVDTYPRFLDHGMGSHVWDVDGNEYIDLIGSWGPLILGHCCQAVEQAVTAAISKGLSFGAPTAAEVEMAQLVCRMTGLEMVRMVNSGTEAVMSALRLARGATGRGKIIKFAGCYHGHSDAMLVKAGSGALTGGAPDSAGVPADIAADTLTASYNDLASVEALLLANPGQVAAVIVEPVAANMGVGRLRCPHRRRSGFCRCSGGHRRRHPHRQLQRPCQRGSAAACQSRPGGCCHCGAGGRQHGRGAAPARLSAGIAAAV